METIIPVENGEVLAALRHFLRGLLETRTVDALYMLMETGHDSVVPALVTDPELVAQANPLAPVMPINGARAVSALTGKQAPGRIGAVLRPCEIRALVELVKLQQASLEKVMLISLDCPGTFEITDFQELMDGPDYSLDHYLEAARTGQGPAYGETHLRLACLMCTQPVYEMAAFRLGLFGTEAGQGIPLTISEASLGEAASELAAELELPVLSSPEPDGRSAIIERVIAERSQVREKELTAIRQRMAAEDGFASVFATCIRCHNCMTACPICYCKNCLFRTASFDHAPDYYLNAARRKGAARMLGDTLLFHLTRLNHMSASCVSCGMCTSACPAEIPVGTVFSAVGGQVQAVFDYHPGQIVGEPLPLVTFQANEYTEVGEQK